MQKRDLTYIFGQGDWQVGLDFVVEFSDLSSTPKRWQSLWKLKYDVAARTLGAHYVATTLSKNAGTD